MCIALCVTTLYWVRLVKEKESLLRGLLLLKFTGQIIRTVVKFDLLVVISCESTLVVIVDR